MSFRHSAMLLLTKALYKPYRPDKPKDYVAAREQENMIVPKIPSDITHREISFAEHTAETFEMVGNPTDKIVCYIHGGGYVGGSAKSRRAISIYVVQNWHYNVISFNYDLAPEVKFPTGHKQCLAAYRELIRQYGAENVILMGESGGGNIILSICQMARDQGIELPAGIIALSPSLQYTKMMDSYRTKGKYDYLHLSFLEEIQDLHFGTHDPEVINHPYASPMYGNYASFPPTYILTSEDERLVDESVVLYETMKQAGVDVALHLEPKMMHAFAMFPQFPETRKCLRDVLLFIQEHIWKRE